MFKLEQMNFIFTAKVFFYEIDYCESTLEIKCNKLSLLNFTTFRQICALYGEQLLPCSLNTFQLVSLKLFIKV